MLKADFCSAEKHLSSHLRDQTFLELDTKKIKTRKRSSLHLANKCISRKKTESR